MELHPTQCPICRTGDGARQLYPANFDPRALNPAIFSARRRPDRIHFRLTQIGDCNMCTFIGEQMRCRSPLASAGTGNQHHSIFYRPAQFS